MPLSVTGHYGCDNEGDEEENRVDPVGDQFLHTKPRTTISINP